MERQLDWGMSGFCSKDIFIDGGDIPAESNSKQHPLAAKFYFWFRL